MKKSLLLSLLLGSASMGLHAQYTILEDLTSSKLQNADFTADAPVTQTIRTYDYDMTDAGAGSGTEGAVALFGMQPVIGWTANTPSDNIKMEKDTRTDGANARAAGVFAYDDESGDELPGLGGAYYAPYAEAGLTSQALGIVAVWGATPKYTQTVSLPAGAYMLVAKIYNAAGTGTISSNYFGFTAGEGAAYLSAKETYTVGVWENDTVVFQLEEAAEGEVSLGFAFGSGSGSAPHLFIDNVKLYSIDTGALIQAKIDEAKVLLLEQIEIGNTYGVDTQASQAVYDNASATLEEVQAAIESQKALNAAGVTDLSAAFIQNPHFSMDEPLEGGICTYDYDCEKNNIPKTNYSMLPVTGWERMKTDNGCASGVYAIGSGAFLGGVDYIVPTTMSDGSTEGKVLGFVTCWTMAVQYKQNVTLPAGKYTLKMSYFNTGGTTAIEKNLIGFVASDGTEYLAPSTTFPVGKWTTDEVSFELTEQTTGYFSLGYKSVNSGSAAMPHFFTDGIALYYVGTDIDPTFLALQAAVSRGETALESVFNADLKNQLQAAVEAGQELIDASSDDADANQAAADAITGMLSAVDASIAAYAKLDAFNNEGGALVVALDKYQGVSSLADKLGTLQDDVQAALEDLSWTTEQIDATIASLDTIIREEIQKVFDEAVASGEPLDDDLDITVLFDQMSYTYSTTAQSAANVPDKEWKYGDATNFKTQYGTAEVWNQSPFTVSRTLSNMPKGKYTITTKGFFRNADNPTNYAAYMEGEEEAKVFAGAVTTNLPNVASFASANLATLPGAALVDEAEGLYIPNSQEGAYNLFENPDYTDILQRSVSTVLTEEGDLTFGVTASEMQGNSWAVWYGFTIAYNALDEDALTAELEALKTSLEEYYTLHDGDFNSYGDNAINTALEEAEGAIEGTEEEKAAAITMLKAAIAEAEANVAAYAAFGETNDLLDAAYTEYSETASANAQAAYDDIEIRRGEVDDMDNESILALVEDMKKVIALFRIPEYDGASDATPIDFTQVIENPSFETGDLTGWTYNTAATGDTKAAENSNATYTINNADGNYVFNTWHGSALEDGYYVSQVLKALPAGTYELQCILASDPGNIIDLSAANGAADFIPADATGEGNETIAAKGIGLEASIIFSIEEGEDVEIKVASSTWFKADNFKLFYFGADSENIPTDIATVEGVSAAAPVAIYSISGAQVSALQKGLNIVKYADGTVKKVLVK